MTKRLDPAERQRRAREREELRRNGPPRTFTRVLWVKKREMSYGMARALNAAVRDDVLHELESVRLLVRQWDRHGIWASLVRV